MNSKDDKGIPEGMMHNALKENKLVTVESVEREHRARMMLWDLRRHSHKFYWKNDPSYWWKHTKKDK